IIAGCSSSTNTNSSDGGNPEGGNASDGNANDANPDTGTSDTGNTGDGGDAASSSLGFTPSNVDVSKLDLTGIGDIDLIGPGCCIGSDGSGFRCGDSTMAKYTVIKQPNQIKVGVYVA